MKIEIRSIDGVQESEKRALKEFEKAFSSKWLGYAAFEMLQKGGGNYEVDLVIVAADRIIVVELKNWNGDIRSDGEQWFCRDEFSERSPVKKTQLKAKVLAKLLKTALGDLTPYVESRVVLCGKNPSLMLQADEKSFVHSLDQFLRLADPAAFTREFPTKSYGRPLDHAQKFRNFFMGTAFKPKVFAYQNYVQSGDAIFEHPKAVYKEYRALNRDDSNAGALMRRWNFSALGMAAGTQKDRALVASREQRVLTFVANRDDVAATMFLPPISSTANSDVTSEHCELFRLPRNHARLNHFVSRFEGKLSLENRIELLRTILDRFGSLHKLGVAHRDIGPHSIWIERPASVLLSGFVAAYFPETETVGSLRAQVSAGDVLLPDDAMDDDKATPFSRDVFLLGVAAHNLLFGVEPEKDQGLFTWNPLLPQVKSVDGKMDGWFQKALSWTATDRFPNAFAMLQALNSIDLGLVRAQIVDMVWFEPFRNAARVERDYPSAEVIAETESTELYRSETADGKFAVKVWWNVRPDEKRPDESLRLLRFLQAAYNIQQCPLPFLSRIKDFGLTPKGAVFLVREWTDGMTIRDWLSAAPSSELRLQTASNLVTAIIRLHEMEITHGDLNPTNVICCAGNAGAVTLIDIPDLRIGEVVAHSPAYAPENWEKVTVAQRDRFGTAVLVREILGEQLTASSQVCEELERIIANNGSHSLEPLLDTLGRSKAPASTVGTEFKVGLRSTAQGTAFSDFLSDNGIYHVTVDRKQANERIAISLTGVRARLRILAEPVSLNPFKMYYDVIGHQQFVDATKRAEFKLAAQIIVEQAALDDAAELVEALRPDVLRVVETASKAKDASAIVVHEGNGARKIWSALIRAEADALKTVTVADQPYIVPGKERFLFVPYRTDGATFDFDDHDEVDVLEEERLPNGERKKVGRLDQRETNSAVLAIEPRSSRWSPALGSSLRIRGRADFRSYEKRKRAVDRILAQRSIIPDLADQFEPTVEKPTTVVGRAPTDEELDEYDIRSASGELEFSLNVDQRMAFQKLAANGPVGFLQGPPGTGKTAFIASFVHFLLSKCGVRRILLVSQSHEAVNNALEKALELARQTGLSVDAVRIGQEGMLAESVAVHHPNAIQQQYRERFSTQIYERLCSIAPSLGLPTAFVRAFTELHLDLGRIKSDLARLAEQQSRASDEFAIELEKRLTARTSVYWEVVENKYGLGRMESVDEAFGTLEKEIERDHRVNSPDAVSRLRRAIELSREWIEVLGSRTGNFVEFLTRTRAIVAGTCVGIGQWQAQVTSNIYDWVIIDEAARATSPELAVPMQVGRRVLLVGDHQQLPPFFDDGLKQQLESIEEDQDVRQGFFVSDFERMFEHAYARNCAAALQTQYRMAPSIGAMVSHCFYPTRELLPGRGPPPLWFKDLPAPLDHEVTWIDTSDLGKRGEEQRSDDQLRTSNESEAKLVLATIRLIFSSRPFYKRLKETVKEGEQAIGVICMYAEQCRIVDRLLAQADWLGARRKEIKVDTVDSYQGKENRIVLVSLVRNNPARKEGFLDKPFRANVALSRAMDRLIIIGATSMWRGRASPLGKVIGFIESNRDLQSVAVVASRELTAAETAHEV